MPHPIQSLIEAVYHKYKILDEGQVASYIPELAKANPNWFGISITTIDGEVFEIGNVGQRFTIQSISKVFTYGMALEDRGCDVLLSRVGVEPTGDPFNSIIRLDENSKRPDNPMVNAGAIATTNLIQGQDMGDRLNRIISMFKRYVGSSDIFIDMPTFLSERATGDRNRSLAYLMRHFGMIDGNIDEVLDLYFQQCAIMVTCHDLAMMGATLANRGVNPITTQPAVNPKYIRDILSVMYTCGMYNFAGEWAYKVGIPAKSGVSGGILGVVPNQMGIAVFSPPLDIHGNSVRGIKVFEALSRELNLHVFAPAAPASPRRSHHVLTDFVAPVPESYLLSS
jgi:glutaminase